MKILITGGAGFIGSNFVCRALADNYSVINIDNLTYAGNLDNLEDYKHHVFHKFYREDICNKNSIENIFFKHQPDVVVHMAAESHVDRSIDCADEFIRTNINGTYILLDVALKYYKKLENKNNFRFIHLSTDEVFGTLGLTGKFDETMLYRPNSPYAASKASSDLLVRSYFKTYGLPTIIVNSSNNYGSKQYPEKLIPLTILNALEQKVLPIYGDGKQIRDWLYVQDHLDALFAIIKNGRIGESYCVGSNNEISNLNLVYFICDILDDLKPLDKSYSSLITFVQDRPGHDFRYATNAEKLMKHTGWSSRTILKDGLKKTVEWYINHFEKLRLNKQVRVRLGVDHEN
ncbi:MAG: dTDP-glucose 4,6-dehydratase [Gammaproteobacteria bacterium]